MSAIPVHPARGHGVQRKPEGFHARLLTGTDWFKHYYTGERVAILATGSEAASILPEVLRTAASVTVFEESPTWVTPVPVPLGPLRRTASRIWLRASVRDAWTRRQLTPHKQFDSSRVTARRYLEHLADVGLAVRSLRYGGGGRPEVEYRWQHTAADGGGVSRPPR